MSERKKKKRQPDVLTIYMRNTYDWFCGTCGRTGEGRLQAQVHAVECIRAYEATTGNAEGVRLVSETGITKVWLIRRAPA